MIFDLIVAVLVFMFGACLGSFANVLILRLPEEQRIGGRSHCMHCKHQLAALDLVPIFSYLFLRGRCRYCGHKISPRYAIIETISGLLVLGAFFRFIPIDPVQLAKFIRAVFILMVLVVVFTVDLEHYLILDAIVFPSAIIVLFLDFVVDFATHASLFNSLTFNGLISVLVLLAFFGAIYFLSGGRWLGFGDVKFSLFLGLATPHPYIGVNIFLSFLIGSYVGLMLLLFGGKNMKSQIPFGTFLAASTAITLFFGPQLVNAYLKLVGLWYLANYS